MNTEPIDHLIEKIKGKFNELVGLPGGDEPPFEEGLKEEKHRPPEHGLTSPDAEGLPSHAGTGIRAQ